MAESPSPTMHPYGNPYHCQHHALTKRMYMQARCTPSMCTIMTVTWWNYLLYRQGGSTRGSNLITRRRITSLILKVHEIAIILIMALLLHKTGNLWGANSSSMSCWPVSCQHKPPFLKIHLEALGCGQCRHPCCNH